MKDVFSMYKDIGLLCIEDYLKLTDLKKNVMLIAYPRLRFPTQELDIFVFFKYRFPRIQT